MQATNNRENQSKTHAAHPSLGKALDPRHAAKRLENRGLWATERAGKIRVVEFITDAEGESHSKTNWFNTWQDALAYYGMETTYRTECAWGGDRESRNRVINPLGQWVCIKCESEMTETQNDLFHYGQGHWAGEL